MMKISVMLMLAVLWYAPTRAQETFVFDNNPGALNISEVESEQLKSHPMGNEVAAKLKLLQDRYTYVEEGTPTSPTNRTVVIKPAIYNSVLKLNRHYKKVMKKGEIDMDSARTEFLRALDIALILYAERTESFEAYLGKLSKPEELILAYKNVELR